MALALISAEPKPCQTHLKEPSLWFARKPRSVRKNTGPLSPKDTETFFIQRLERLRSKRELMGAVSTLFRLCGHFASVL